MYSYPDSDIVELKRNLQVRSGVPFKEAHDWIFFVFDFGLFVSVIVVSFRSVCVPGG